MGKQKKKTGKRSALKTVLKVVLILLLAVLLLFGGYFAYVFIAYHRLGDMKVDPHGSASDETVKTGKEYKFTSYNIGFGAYESDFGFFMDGGTEGRARSAERVDKNMKNIADTLAKENADFYFIQEVDTDSTRSYHIDERVYLTDKLTNKMTVFAQNFDSPFLFYPFIRPHGSAKSGLMTFSSFGVTSAERVELPIETGVMKLVDLDRCYSKSRVPVEGGKELVLYNFHLSAYTSDGKIATEQLELLISDIEDEYKAGNYCIAGGDFNKDILGDSSVYFGKADKEYTWAQPIPEELLKDKPVSIVAPLDKDDPVPSCRNADGPYHEGQFVLTIDGFMVTDNITVTSSKVIDTGFAYSDHNPVTMTFKLN